MDGAIESGKVAQPMAIALSFIFFVFLIALFAALSIPFAVMFFIGLRKRNTWLTWLGGVSTGVILSASITAFFVLIYFYTHPSSESTDSKEMTRTYAALFKMPPERDFVPLHQRIYGLGDYGTMHFTFRVSPATFEKLRAVGFSEIPASDFLATTGKDAPSWWIQTNKTSDVCFQNSEWKGTFSSNTAYLFYDKDSGVAYFYSVGVD